jgi:hypothetical protein
MFDDGYENDKHTLPRWRPLKRIRAIWFLSTHPEELPPIDWQAPAENKHVDRHPVVTTADYYTKRIAQILTAVVIGVGGFWLSSHIH